jgi:hypothetical protein
MTATKYLFNVIYIRNVDEIHLNFVRTANYGKKWISFFITDTIGEASINKADYATVHFLFRV